jgi:hypothetical protein
LQTLTDFGEFSRREINTLLLYFRPVLLADSAFLLAVNSRVKRLELGGHFLHHPREVGQLASHACYVLFGCQRYLLAIEFFPLPGKGFSNPGAGQGVVAKREA